MKTVDNERTVPGATSVQQNVDGLLHVCCGHSNLNWLLYQLEGYGAIVDRNQQIVSIPSASLCQELFSITIQIWRQGWYTQIGLI